MPQPLGYLKETPSQTAGPYVHIGCTPNFTGIAGVYETDLGSGPLTNERRAANALPYAAACSMASARRSRMRWWRYGKPMPMGYTTVLRKPAGLPIRIFPDGVAVPPT